MFSTGGISRARPVCLTLRAIRRPPASFCPAWAGPSFSDSNGTPEFPIMIGALGTLLCFAVTPVFARRAAVLLGSLQANFWRLLVAALLLGAWAHWAGRGVGGAAFGWFFLGGIVGFGIGGVAMFQSLPRLGSNLSTLIVQCGSAIVAAAAEWLWLGTVLTPIQLVCASLRSEEHTSELQSR